MDSVILYQVVQWMDERTRLTNLIHHVDRNSQFLLNKRDKLDESMFMMLKQWTQPPEMMINVDLKTVEPPPVRDTLTLTR